MIKYRVLNRVNGGPEAPSREEVAAQPTALADAGEAARGRLRALVTEVRAVVHQGVSDEEYVAALKALRTMVAHVEGHADL